MLENELRELIASGENSGIEFKRDDVRPEQLAKEFVAFANYRGGRVLLGVEDDGAVSGIARPDLERWVMDTVFGRFIHPAIIPYYEEVPMNDGRRIAIVSVEQGIAKPYVLRANDREDIYVRIGSVSRLASREQQARLFQESRLIHTEVLPVSGAGLNVLDARRAGDYVTRLLGDVMPEDAPAIRRRLGSLGFMTETERGVMATLAGLVLFGRFPRRLLRQAGLRVMIFPGEDRSYSALLDEVLDFPLVGLWQDGVRVEPGLVETTLDKLAPFVTLERGPQGESLIRKRTWIYPVEVLRESLLNAFTHRDWTRAGDVELCRYSDRLEVTSPGALPNTMTVEKMRAGQRSPRNPLLVDVLRDYGYVDARGMGIRRKIIPVMRSLGAREPGIEATEDYVRIVLYRPDSPSAES